MIWLILPLRKHTSNWTASCPGPSLFRLGMIYCMYRRTTYWSLIKTAWSPRLHLFKLWWYPFVSYSSYICWSRVVSWTRPTVCTACQIAIQASAGEHPYVHPFWESLRYACSLVCVCFQPLLYFLLNGSLTYTYALPGRDTITRAL
jgi:hypothetical protein